MKQKAKVKRLEARLKDHAATINGDRYQEAKVASRAERGGYHRPGSYKK